MYRTSPSGPFRGRGRVISARNIRGYACPHRHSTLPRIPSSALLGALRSAGRIVFADNLGGHRTDGGSSATPEGSVKFQTVSDV